VQRLPDDGQVPMFVFDAGYDPIAIGAALTDTAAQVLVRIRGDRVFYTDPNHRPAGTIGRPPVTAPGSPCPTQQARPCPLPNCPSRTNAMAGCT
jgi:hypothetical protein